MVWAGEPGPQFGWTPLLNVHTLGLDFSRLNSTKNFLGCYVRLPRKCKSLIANFFSNFFIYLDPNVAFKNSN